MNLSRFKLGNFARRYDTERKVIANVEEVTLGYGQKIVLQKINVKLNNGDHVAVVGLNGSAKQHFLKFLAKKISPTQKANLNLV